MPDSPSDLKSHHPPEYHKGTGTDALAQGEASQANAAAQNVPEPPASPPLPGQQTAPPGTSNSPPTSPTAPEAGLPPALPPRHVPTSDVEKFLLGPTQRPQEPAFQPNPTLPGGYEAWLPLLGQASSDPNSPMWVRQFYLRMTEAAKLQEALRAGAFGASA